MNFEQIADDLDVKVDSLNDLIKRHEEANEADAANQAIVKQKLKYMTYQDINLGKGSCFSLSRVLDSGNDSAWTLSTESSTCWVCDSWNYAVIFWSDEIARFNEKQGVQIGKEEKIRIANVIKRDHPDDFAQSPELPVLFTQSTNWKGRTFTSILDLLRAQEQRPNWQKEVDRQVRAHAKEYEYLCSDPVYVEKYRNELLLDALTKWEAGLLKDWKERIRKTIKYKKP